MSTFALGHRLLSLAGLMLATSYASAEPMQFVQISSGEAQTCAVDVQGGVECWGRFPRRTTPAPIQGLTSPASKVDAGVYHSCAVVADGLRCWGANESGQLGNGGTEASSIPVAVATIHSGVTDVAAGPRNTCAIVNGGARCWGNNQFGQIGNGHPSQSPSLTPEAVVGLEQNVSAIAMGWASACAIANGGVKCWGSNVSGELGNGSDNVSSIPVAVVGLGSGVTALSGYANTYCAIVGGAAKCWGAGPLGTSNATSSNVPVDVTGLGTNVTDIAVGGRFACATQNSASVYCWGFNDRGSLGNGGYGLSFLPQKVAIDGPGLWSINAGREHACLLRGGKAYCWGGNVYGQLGLGSESMSSYDPVAVTGLQDGVTQLSAANFGACAVRSGDAYCWGENIRGQALGGTYYDMRGTPTRIAGLSGVSMVAAGSYPVCSIANGAVWCWGLTDLGNGSGSGSLAPVPAIGLDSGISGVAVGFSFGCAIRNGAVWCWGNNYDGILGDGTNIGYQLSPVLVPGLDSDVTSISTGTRHACAVVGGAAKCWGSNSSGQAGTGTTSESVPRPTTVLGLDTSVSQVVARSNYSCAIKNGGVWCWGGNVDGRLGNGSYDDSAEPTPVIGLREGVAEVSLGPDHACALLLNQSVRCWGSGRYGELGSVSPTSSSVPLQAVRFPARTEALALGGSTTCGIADGAAFCLGWNGYGQLGNSAVPTVPTPTPVIQNGPIFQDGFDLRWAH